MSNIPEAWEPPPLNMYRLKFNGAVKGNPGPNGLGGVFRNAIGEILGIYWGFIGGLEDQCNSPADQIVRKMLPFPSGNNIIRLRYGH